MQRFIREIKRRRVIPVAAYYVISVWLILQVADVLLPAWGVPERAIQFIVYAALLGFPVALAFGWRYNLGPDGISRTLPATAADARGAAVSLTRKDYLLLAIMSLAAVAIGAWTIGQLVQDEPAAPTGPPNSVAVLAFEDVSKGDQSIAPELADSLVASLIAIHKLKVTGRESSFYFAGRSTPLRQIARMLHARHLLTSHVSGSADELSISVRLVRLPEATTLWAQTFNTPARRAYDVVAPIVEQVAATLRVDVSDTDRLRRLSRYSGNPEALGLARLSRQAGETGDYERGIRLVEQALKLDPDITQVQVWRALLYLYSFSDTGKPALDIVRKAAQESLDKAQALDADNAEYYFARGMQARRETWLTTGTPRWQHAVEENFDRAIALNPSDAQAYVSYSIYFRRLRRFNDASRLLETALDYDPLHPGAILQYSRSLSALGRRDEALEYALRLLELYGWGAREVASRYAEYSQLDLAIEWFLKASPADPRNARDVAELLGSLREPALAIAWFEKASSDEVFGAYARSEIDVLNGQPESAYKNIMAHIDLSLPDASVSQYWLFHAAQFARLSGDAGAAITLIERLAPELSDPLAPRVTEQNVSSALSLVSALKAQGGNPVRIGVLAGMILNTARDRPAIGFDGIGLRAARVYALQGEENKAIAAFQAAYEQGFRRVYTSAGRLPRELESLVGNPRFDRLLENMNADLAAMAERAKAILNAGPRN